MATKFILIGGRAWRAKDGGRAFCLEATNGLDNDIKILICMFAEPEEKWMKKLEENRSGFRSNLPDRDLKIELADPGIFTEQVKEFDIVFFYGGRTSRLLQKLKPINDWKDFLNNKTIIGTSAGALAISGYGFDCDENAVIEGLNLLPVKVIPHYNSDYNKPNIDWDNAYAELKAYKEELPIYALGEGEFVVIEK